MKKGWGLGSKMKLHRIASEVLVGALGEYVEGLDPGEVVVSLGSGKCTLTNLRLKVRKMGSVSASKSFLSTPSQRRAPSDQIWPVFMRGASGPVISERHISDGRAFGCGSARSAG